MLILSFTCSHHIHPPPLSLCLIWPYRFPIFAPTSVCVTVRLGLCGIHVYVPVCVYVWHGHLIPSARKCPAARNLDLRKCPLLCWYVTEPNRACSHFQLAWSNTAHTQLKCCQKLVERNCILPKTSLRHCKKKSAKNCTCCSLDYSYPIISEN